MTFFHARPGTRMYRSHQVDVPENTCGSVVSLSFIFPHPPEDKKEKKSKKIPDQKVENLKGLTRPPPLLVL